MSLHADHLYRAWVMPILLFATVGFAGRARAADDLPKGTLSGTVVDPYGKPVPGASVFLDDDSSSFKPIVKTLTREDGSFQLGALDPVYRDIKRLRVLAPGFAPQTAGERAITVYAGADSNVGQIQLDHGQIITGQVLDANGTPRAGAAVECQAQRYTTAAVGSSVTPTYKLSTDEQGRFSTPPLPVSFAGITVRVAGREMPWVRVPVGPEGRAEIEPIHLRISTPIVGTVRDDTGKPLAGINVYCTDSGTMSWLNFDQLTTDPNGRFLLDGLGPNCQLLIDAPNRIGVNWVVHRHADGLHWASARGAKLEEFAGPVPELDIKLASVTVTWIEGRATDADTGLPVHLEKIVCCLFDRKPSGEVALNSCKLTEYRQEPNGNFRLPYGGLPSEFHLTLSAAGYDDAEAFTPPAKPLQPITGIDVKLHKSKNGVTRTIARQTLSGAVTRDGKPVVTGWVALRRLSSYMPDKVNVDICRGRTVAPTRFTRPAVAIRNGVYSLDVPSQGDDWAVEMQEPGQPLTRITGIAVGLDEAKKLDIAAVHGGGITGRVDGIPPQWARDTWVVAFTRGGVHYETRVGPDGSFSFTGLAPDEYGLKAGHDAFLDPERPPQSLPDGDPAYSTPADPWKRATVVNVEADQTAKNVRLELPGT